MKRRAWVRSETGEPTEVVKLAKRRRKLQ